MDNKNIIQSLWTAPLSNNIQIWSSPEYWASTWILSCLKLKQLHGRIGLYTDDLGYDILINCLSLPYDWVSKDLNSIDKDSTNIWTLGKLMSYSLSKDSFIHVDGDVIVGEKLQMPSGSVIVQHIETNYPHNEEFDTLLRKNNYTIPQSPTPTNGEITEINAGVLGIGDIVFKECYLNSTFNFIFNNKKRILSSTSDKEIIAFNTFAEQRIFYQTALNLGIPIETVLKYDVSDDYAQLVNFRKGINSNYIHPVGYLKKNPIFGERIAEILYRDYPVCFLQMTELLPNILQLLGYTTANNKEKNHDEIINNIRDWSLQQIQYSNLSNYAYRLNPYIVMEEDSKRNLSISIPSILSSPRNTKRIKFQLGILGNLTRIIKCNWGNEYFDLKDLLKIFPVSDELGEKKIEAALIQLINMHVVIIGGNGKACNEYIPSLKIRDNGKKRIP